MNSSMKKELLSSSEKSKYSIQSLGESSSQLIAELNQST